jgi:predicted amidophosphoribosyltransferase
MGGFDGSKSFSARVDLGWLLLPLSIAVIRFLVLATRRKRLDLKHCERCGYDLLGITTRCPECGEPTWFETRSARARECPPGHSTPRPAKVHPHP